MAVSFVNSDVQTASPVSMVATGSDRLVVPFAIGRSSSVLTISDITLGGVSVAGLIGAGVDGGTAGYCGFGYILDANTPGSGSHSISENWNEGTPTDDAYGVIELSGVDQATPFGTHATNSATDQSDGYEITVNITGAASEFVLVYIGTGDGVASSGSGGHTLPIEATSVGEIYDNRTHIHWGYIASVASSNETYSFNASVDGSANIDSIYAGVIVVNAAAGGGGPTPIPPKLHNIGNQFSVISAHRLNGVLE